MRSCIFQLRSHQAQSAFSLSQAESAFHLYPFTFVPIILCLVPEGIFFRSSQSRAGQTDPSLFAIAQIFLGPVYLIRQYPAGIVALTPVEVFNHLPEFGRFMVGVKGMILQSGPAITYTDVQFHPKLNRFSGFSPHNWADKRLT